MKNEKIAQTLRNKSKCSMNFLKAIKANRKMLNPKIRDYECVHLHGIKSQLIRIIHSKQSFLIYAEIYENRINYCPISLSIYRSLYFRRK